MRFKIAAAALAAALVLPVAAQAQGTIPGAVDGARRGTDAAGPIGGIVGGAVGAATGTVGGILGVDTRPRFRDYAVREARPSYRWDGDVVVGSTLPSSGVTYYDVPADYGVRGYRYTRVNDRYVLVDPGSRRIVEVID
jgi:hypothetical protein